MTSLIPLWKSTYPQSFMLIYDFLLELWGSNLNEKKKKKIRILPIIDVLGYDGQNSSFSSSPPPPYSDSTPISQKGSHITKHSSALYIGIAKVLPIIDVLGYDGQNSSFSSSSSSFSCSDSTPITQKGSHIST